MHKFELAVRILNTTDGVLLASSAAILWTLRLYSRKLGITWNRQMKGISSSLLLFLTAKACTIFVIGVGTTAIASIAAPLGQIAYLIAIIRLGVCLAPAKENIEPITEQITATLAMRLSEMKLAARDVTGHTH